MLEETLGVRSVASTNPRVLVAEDDPHLRRLITRTLTVQGCEVTDVGRGWDLYASVLQANDRRMLPDLIVTDIYMPGLDGLSVAQLVRSWGWSIPILLITGFASERKLDSAARVGASVVLSKPFAMRDLLIAVSCLLA